MYTQKKKSLVHFEFDCASQDEHRVAWETLVPCYRPSTVPALELRRENFAIALAGQLCVILCRALTGHWGATGVGLGKRYEKII